MYQITDGINTAVISPLGAELVSFVDRDGIQRIWQADPEIWGRHAPLLFPIIGRLRDSRYELRGQSISISTHGFARDLPFALVEQTSDSLTLALEDREETRAVYPFSFRLEVEYALRDGVLTKTHRITNRSQEKMPFELGGHDGYCTSLLPGETMKDYFLQFEGVHEVHPHVLDPQSCFVSPETVTIPLESGKWLDCRPFLAEMDTAVLDRLPVSRVTLSNRAGTKKVIVTYEDFDYLGLWTATKDFDTNYLCIEPWSSLPECTTTGPSLWDKVGIQCLQPGETKTLCYTMEFV
jgi:galactose mutarotase-like enzyme